MNLNKFRYRDAWLAKTPKTWPMKEVLDKLDFIKIKNLCSAKDSVKRMRRQATDWEKIFPKDTSDKGLLPKYTKSS